jgi:hypothetical protein
MAGRRPHADSKDGCAGGSMNSIVFRMRAGILCGFVLLIVACGGGGGGAGSGAPAPTPPDTTAPDTTISQSAPSISGTSASFSFTATEAGTFEGRLDGAVFMTLTSPHVLSGLAEGSHTFEVRARDTAGNVDATPATFTWTVDATPPQVQLLFPTPRFYTDAETVTVRGTAQDPAGIQSLSVNGVDATSSNGFVTWSATIPVPLGITTVDVARADAVGNAVTTTAATMQNRGTFVHEPAGAAFDTARQRFLVVDGATDAIVAIRRADSVGHAFVPGELPGVAQSAGYGQIVIDATQDRALVVAETADELVEFDLETSTRHVISAAGAGGATSLAFSTRPVLDAAAAHAYVAVGSSIVRIDLASGTRSEVFSDPFQLASPVDMVYDATTDPAAPRLLLLLADSMQIGVVAFDIGTGMLTDFSTASQGSGPMFMAPIGMTLDAGNPQLLVMDGIQGLMTVALAGGNRIRQELTGFEGLANGAVMFDGANRTLHVSQRAGWIAAIDVDARIFERILGSSLASPNGVGPGGGAVAIEQASGRATSLITLVGGAAGQLRRFDLATGNGTVISDSFSIGAGPGIDTPLDLVLDLPNNRALIVQGFIVAEPQALAVDLTSGDRTVLVEDDGSDQLGIPWRFAHDASGNRLVYGRIDGQGGGYELHAVNLATRETSLVSGVGAGGPGFGSTGRIVLQPTAAPDRAIVTDTSSNRILSVDLGSGQREVFNTVASGNAGSLFSDEANSRLFVSNSGAPASLFTMPLSSTGAANTLISGPDPVTTSIRGVGPAMHEVVRFEVDLSAEVAYVASRGNAALFAVDVVTGDRVVIAR